MSNETYNAGTEVVLDNGDEGTILSYAKGWYAVELFNGETIKVRGKRIEDVLEDEDEDEEVEDEEVEDEDEEVEDEEELVSSQMSEKLKKARVRYTKTTAASGSSSADNDDSVAKTLRGMDLLAIYKLASELLEISFAELKTRYGYLNFGSQRMNLGNRIRGAIKRGNLVEKDVVKAAKSIKV